ncbi:MAG: hypothetical protein AAF493_00795 [Pseudomonadota bacterium]
MNGDQTLGAIRSAHIAPLGDDGLAELEQFIGPARAASGYVPTSLCIMAHKPELLAAFSELIGAVMRNAEDMERPRSPRTRVGHFLGFDRPIEWRR